jgi:hypothetical protein
MKVQFESKLREHDDLFNKMKELMSEARDLFKKFENIRKKPWDPSVDAEERENLKQYQALQHQVFIVYRPHLRGLSRDLTKLAGMSVQCYLPCCLVC